MFIPGTPPSNHVQNRNLLAVNIALMASMHTISSIAVAQLGVPISAPAAVNTNSASDGTTQDAIPDLATDGQGTWIAVWQLTGAPGWPNGTDPDIYFSRSTNNGFAWTAPAPLNHTAATDSAVDLAPHVFTDGAGHWLCAWMSTFPLNGSIGDRDIVISRSLDNGQTWSPLAALNTNAVTDVGGDFDIDMVFDQRGVWVAAWRTVDTLSNSIGTDGDILFARSADHGATWTAPAPLNTNATSDQGLDQKPQLETDGQNHWIAVWQSTESFAGQPADNDILCALSGDNGVSWSAPARLNSNAATDNRPDTDPRIVTNATGQWLVVWSSTNNVTGNGIEGDILLSRSNDNGQMWTAATPLNTNAVGDAGADVTPTLTWDGSGNWLAAWTSNDSLGNTIGTDNDILISRSINNGLTWSAPIPLNTNAATDLNTGTDEFSQITCDMNGGFMGVWESRGMFGTDRDVLWARLALPDCNNNTLPDAQETDCNKNNIPDSCDIASGSSLDANRNGIPDECETPPNPCPADCDLPHNFIVDIDDLVTVITNWGSTAANNPADVNNNGVVNIDDMVLVITNWGPCP